ncbi:transposase [Weissella uvarum]|uniref:transposase n=1 Tax=Weissella uvarum TaxID=1479233 RepID=UPI0019601672|nr:transposase [Weissella uvarum]MBM7616969.1 transposase [Weissella uvarum]MCM0595269.1 transposase [Weissella uvarum]
MKKSSGKHYSNDFKERIVRLYLDGHQSMTALSREYGVTTSTISKWGQAAKPIQLTNGIEINQTEINALIKENEQLKEENEILKLAAVLLGKR